MRKTQMENTFDIFALRMDSYYQFLQKVYFEDEMKLHIAEKSEIFEAFVLKVHVTWEKFVIRLLIDCLNRDSSQYAEYMGFKKLKKHIPRNQCEGMLLGLGYLSFRDVSDIQTKAKRVLIAQYNPFSHISNKNRNKINEFYHIRNYVVHESSVAKRNLMNKVYKNRYRMEKFCAIGDFLLRKEKGTNTPRLGNHINVFGNCAIEMAKFLGQI